MDGRTALVGYWARMGTAPSRVARMAPASLTEGPPQTAASRAVTSRPEPQ